MKTAIKSLLTNPLFYVSTLALAGCSKQGNHWGMISRRSSLAEINFRPGAEEREKAVTLYIDSDGMTPLGRAAFSGDFVTVILLLDPDKSPGVDVNAQDCNGKTALHWAVLKGHLDIVQELLRRGAQRDIRDNDGNTAVFVAGENVTMAMAIATELSPCPPPPPPPPFILPSIKSRASGQISSNSIQDGIKNPKLTSVSHEEKDKPSSSTQKKVDPLHEELKRKLEERQKRYERIDEVGPFL